MVTEYKEICAICGRPKENIHHMVFGRGLRELADEDGLTIPLCGDCHRRTHESGIASAWSKIAGQLYYEKDKGRDEFLKRYGRSYL